MLKSDRSVFEQMLSVKTMVKVSNYFDFYRCYGNQNGHQNRLKIGNWPFWSKFETFDRDINREHKQIPKRYFN